MLLIKCYGEYIYKSMDLIMEYYILYIENDI